jgi:predicted transcriptional regulator
MIQMKNQKPRGTVDIKKNTYIYLRLHDGLKHASRDKDIKGGVKNLRNH